MRAMMDAGWHASRPGALGVSRAGQLATSMASGQPTVWIHNSQLEKTCRLWRQIQPEPFPPEEEPLRRFVRYRDSDDGMVIIEAHLHPEEAARVQKAIEIRGGQPAPVGRRTGGLRGMPRRAARLS